MAPSKGLRGGAPPPAGEGSFVSGGGAPKGKEGIHHLAGALTRKNVRASVKKKGLYTIR